MSLVSKQVRVPATLEAHESQFHEPTACWRSVDGSGAAEQGGEFISKDRCSFQLAMMIQVLLLFLLLVFLL